MYPLDKHTLIFMIKCPPIANSNQNMLRPPAITHSVLAIDGGCGTVACGVCITIQSSQCVLLVDEYVGQPCATCFIRELQQQHVRGYTPCCIGTVQDVHAHPYSEICMYKPTSPHQLLRLQSMQHCCSMGAS